MDIANQIALTILDEDIALHEDYLRRAGTEFLNPGFDIPSLWRIADDVRDKRYMKKVLLTTQPSRSALNDIIERIDSYYIPTHKSMIGNTNVPKVWQGDEHHEKWIKNYSFIRDLMKNMMTNATME